MRKAFIILIAFLTLAGCEYFYDDGIKKEPKLYMFAIGIGYDKDGSEFSQGIRNLNAARGDAYAMTEQIAHIVEGKMDYEIMLFTDEEEGFRLSSVTPLSTEKIYSYGKEMINKEKLSRIINEESFSSAPDSEDIVIFYYAGHGEDRTGNLVYSYSYESGKYSESTMSARDLYDDFLSQWEGRKLIILDSCYSGNFIEDGDLAESIKYENGEKKGYDLSKALTLSFNSLNSNESAKTDSYVLSATHKDQLAYEAESLKHGYFTYALLDYFGYDFENEEAVYTTKFDKKSISVEDLYEAALDYFPYKNSLKNSTPSTTLSRFDMVIFDFK